MPYTLTVHCTQLMPKNRTGPSLNVSISSTGFPENPNFQTRNLAFRNGRLAALGPLGL